MSSVHRLRVPLREDDVRDLAAGDQVLLSGTVYGARDAAHKRLVEALGAGQALPIPLEGQVIYYVGPAPARPGEVIGPAGPTTSSRMDPYTPPLLAHGLRATIGKGKRSWQVREAMVARGAVYLVAVGGAAVLAAERIRRAEIVAYPDLGAEAIRLLELDEFPLVVANDVHGGDLFERGREEFRSPRTGLSSR
ncbi:MAG: Fe-S-containing hydro-lyase [Gemmatimonadetes bacterium]|nr:Fe-S-containing hydro-lyase [Gemmatimonadota bacterium]